MVIDELIIRIRATADGVKEGVNAAKGELNKLSAERDKLKQELALKLNSKEIVALREELKKLETARDNLRLAIKFPVDSADVKRLQADLRDAIAEKKMLEDDLKLNLDARDFAVAQQELDRLTAYIPELEEEINLKIKADADDAKKQLNEIEHTIAGTKKEIDLKIEASGADQTAARIKDVDAEMQKLEKTSQEVEAAFPQIAIAAAAAFAGIVAAVKTGVDAFNTHTAAMNGYAAQMQYIGVSISDAMDAVRDKASDGLISPADVAASIKNLTSYGFSLQQATQLLDRMKDAAAYNRQAHYSFGEAVRVTTEGIKNENSTLSDAVGVSKNISVMMDDYAESMDKTAASLSKAEKQQAIYNGFMAETEAMAGNAAEYADTLAGAQGELAAATEKAAVAYGGALAPSLKETAKLFTPILDSTASIIENNKSLAAGATALVAGFAVVSIGIAAYNKLLERLTIETLKAAAAQALLNPAAIVFGLAAAAVVGLGTAIAEANEKQEELNQKMEEYNTIVQEGATEQNIDSLKATKDELAGVGEEIDELTAKFDEYGKKVKELNSPDGATSFESSSMAFENQVGVYDSIIRKLDEYGIVIEKTGDMEEDIAKGKAALTAAIQAGADAISDYNARGKENIATIAAISGAANESVSSLYGLRDAYETLASGEQLSIENMLELIKLHPKIAEYISKTGDLTLKNGEIIKEVAEIDKIATANQIKSDIENTKSEIAQASARVQAAHAEYAEKARIAGEYYSSLRLGAADAAEQDRLNALTKLLLELEASLRVVEAFEMPDISLNEDDDTGLEAQKEEIDEVIRKYEELKKAYDQDIQQNEYSVSAKMTMLEELKAKILEIADLTDPDHNNMLIEIDIQLKNLKREELTARFAEEKEKIAAMYRDDPELMDYQAVMDAWKQFWTDISGEYREFPEILAGINDEIDDEMIKAADGRNSKLLSREQKATDDIIAEYERRNDLLRELDGLKYTDENGDEQEYKYSALDEMKFNQKLLDANQKRIDELEAEKNAGALDDEEYKELQQRYKQREAWNNEMVSLEIQHLKELQAAEQEARDKRIEAQEKWLKEEEDKQKERARSIADAYKQIIDMSEEQNKEILEDIKARYSEEIEMAEDAADAEIAMLEEASDAKIAILEKNAAAEIAVYEDRIKAIDDLLKQEDREDLDNEQLDKIRRLQEQLKFETDDANKYELQKEISNLQDEYDERKRREGLEDERDSLSDQIDAVKKNLDEELEAVKNSYNARIEAARLNLEEKKALLEDERDAEIKRQEDAHEAYVERLEDDLKAFQGQSKETLKELQKRLENEKIEYAKAAKVLEEADKTAAENKRTLMWDNMTDIINDIIDRASEFFDAGSQSGSVFADGFIDQLERIYDAEDELSYRSSGDDGGENYARANNISVQNTFTMPVVTPSKVAASTKSALESMTRYI